MTLAPARTSILPDRITTPTLRSFLRSVPSVDEVGAQERVAALSTRSIKKESKRVALDLIIRMMDLTTLEGKDTAGKVAQMSAKAIRPDPTDPTVPSVAAVCVYPAMVKFALEATEGSTVKVASVATYFPSGLVDTDLKVEEASRVVRPNRGLGRAQRGGPEKRRLHPIRSRAHAPNDKLELRQRGSRRRSRSHGQQRRGTPRSDLPGEPARSSLPRQ